MERSEPSAAASSDALTLPPPPWRRPALLLAGASLLALGVALNLERLGLSPEAEETFAERLPIPEQAEAPPPIPIHERLADARNEHRESRHKGEEGKMGRPSSKQKSGLYAMKGPRSAGVLGQMQQNSAHFLASPYGGAFAVGNDDEDVWGGLSGAEGESYQSPIKYARTLTAWDTKSTFSIDVDTAAYSNMRRFLKREQQLPPPAAVRSEELVNYFDYRYPEPTGDRPIAITTEVGPAPWDANRRLVQIGLQGERLEAATVPARNLVFLVDVSGSMNSADKLPLVTRSLGYLAFNLRPEDRISIVTYAGEAGIVLPPTAGSDTSTIIGALDDLESGGGTNGAGGIQTAYALAEKSFIQGGINRVLMATDGDFNVGVSSHDELVSLIEAKRRSGVYLSVLGFGTGNLNDHTMEQIADHGNGNYAYIDGDLEAQKVLVQQAQATLVTIAKDVKVQVEFDPEQVGEHRLVGYRNRVLAHRDFADDNKDAGEIGAGHTVTAMYEIELTNGVDLDDALMDVSIRYKEPEQDESQLFSVSVHDESNGLRDTSDNFRFASAVAAFGEKLSRDETLADISFTQIAVQANGALGEDYSCYRHEFVELVVAAAALTGEKPMLDLRRCTPVAVPPPLAAASPGVFADTDTRSFIIEVLRVLPPMLALPLFFFAIRRPRRRS